MSISRLRYSTFHFSDNIEVADIMCIKEKLDRALRTKLLKIDKQSQREAVEIWRVNMSAKRLEKETYYRKVQEEAAIKQREKTALKQKVELHEAYQLIFREHHIRVKRRARQKMLAVTTMKRMMKSSNSADINLTSQHPARNDSKTNDVKDKLNGEENKIVNGNIK